MNVLHNSNNWCKIFTLRHPTICILRTVSNREPDALILTKNTEVPIICVPSNEVVDIIGPPDPVSNLRPIIRGRLLNETNLQRRLRELQDATQAWNQKFWTDHNRNFSEQRQLYVKSHSKAASENRTLTADEMSEFYKAFLDENWKKHIAYNFRWYRRNFELLVLALRVTIQNIFKGS